MHVPLPVLMASIPGADAGDSGYVIHLNRSGINSIDPPREKITVGPGSSLKVRFLNRGAPIHITITSANAGMFSDFFHENMYIVDESVLTIPIRKDSLEGFFDLEILAGYGAMKMQVRVHVSPPAVLRPPEELPLQPVAHGRPHLLMIMMGIALVLYVSWLYTTIELLNICAFITLITGALYTWYRQQ
jgi:hypothetical protein